MQVQVFKPNNTLVQKLVKRYIFLRSNEEKYHSFTCYPNTNHCLGILLHKKINRIDNNTIVFEKSKTSLHYLSGIYTQPLQFKAVGNYCELCIDFKPLALEKFGLQGFSKIKFAAYPLNNCYTSMLYKAEELLNWYDKSGHADVNSLDTILLSMVKEETGYVYEAINHLEITDLDTLKKNLFKSERSIYRLFNEQLSISPHRYFEIKKLQACLSDFKINAQLIDIIAQHNLFDHSHLNKLFKKYTHLSPSTFKNRISYFENVVIKL